MLGKFVKKLSKKDINELFVKELLNTGFKKDKLEKLYSEYELNINFTNQSGESYLHITLDNHKNESSLWLIEKGINVSIENDRGIIPFDIAIENQNHRVVQTILDKVEVDTDKKNIHGRTYLQDAVILGDHEMAKILIEHGADINSRDNRGQNILFDALSYGNKDFIEYLLSLDGIDLNNVDEDGNNLLHHNYSLTNDEIAVKLIQSGVSPNIRNQHGETYLSIVAQRGVESFHIIETAVASGFDINSRVANDNNILMEVLSALSNVDPIDEAKRHSLLAMGEKLIDSGIDINAKNSNGESALFQAVKSNDVDTTILLLDKGIKVDLQNNSGETALFYACYGGIEKLQVTLNLIKSGADPTIANYKKQTVLEILNNLVLSNHGKEEYINNAVMKYAISGTRFMNVLKAIFKYSKHNLNFLDSQGDPIFFSPLLYDHIALFKLYTKGGVDLQMKNKKGKNLFFEYVLKVFKDNDTEVDFETGLSMLISAKVDHNSYDETGWTVISKVIAQTPCNIDLFKALLKRVRFDYKIVDKLGRSVIHSAVWSGRTDIIKVINHIDSEIKNVPDHYGILPCIYAALIGNKEVLLYFIEIKTKIKTNKSISQAAVRKFSPLLKNIERLKLEAATQTEESVITTVAKQLRKDFVIK